MTEPRVSVVVRSLGRLAALAELLERLLEQKHDSFEVVVVEQTVDAAAGEMSTVESLEQDPRIRLLRSPPLGGPGARNAGVKAARGAVVLLIDDDDLPLTTDWIAAHESYFSDPDLVGVTARHVREPGEPCPYPWRPFVRSRCMRYSVLKTPYTYARFDEDVDGVGWLHGTNASVRRALAVQAGLWDTTVRSQDEHSFAFRLLRVMHSGQYLAFRAHPPVLRRLDIPGGMDKRYADPRGELSNHLRFCNQVVGKYFPRHYRWGYPLYLGWALGRTYGWIWDSVRSGQSVGRRLADSWLAVRALPSVAQQVRAEPRTERPGDQR